MEKLVAQLDKLLTRLKNADNVRRELENLRSVFPFSEYEYLISTLLANDKLTFDEYLEIRDDYINRNLYLPIFEITAPRGFGDTWAFGHLLELEPRFQRPSKNTDKNYRAEYDLFLNWRDDKAKEHYIKIEVKASRANDRERNDEPLFVKALAANSKRPFLMNFQQLKPSCCDVFLWIAVYRDKIKYWVLNSTAVRKNKNFAPQHRNKDTANREENYRKSDIYEGQIMVTEKNIGDFDKYLAMGNKLYDAVVAAYQMAKS